MRRKVEENVGTLGVFGVALVAIVLYSLWGMFILQGQRQHDVAAHEQNLAVK